MKIYKFINNFNYIYLFIFTIFCRITKYEKIIFLFFFLSLVLSEMKHNLRVCLVPEKFEGKYKGKKNTKEKYKEIKSKGR